MIYVNLQLKTLISLCPKESASGVFRLNNRDQDAVIALGIYLLESHLQHKEKILPYLLKLARNLGKVVWLDEIRQHLTDRKFGIMLGGCVFEMLPLFS